MLTVCNVIYLLAFSGDFSLVYHVYGVGNNQSCASIT